MTEKYSVPNTLKPGDADRWREEIDKNSVILPPTEQDEVDRLPDELPSGIFRTDAGNSGNTGNTGNTGNEGNTTHTKEVGNPGKGGRKIGGS